MKRSPLTALLRVYDNGPDYDRVVVYYIDILGEQQLVGVCSRSQIVPFAEHFAREQEFEAYALEFVWLQPNAAT